MNAVGRWVLAHPDLPDPGDDWVQSAPDARTKAERWQHLQVRQSWEHEQLQKLADEHHKDLQRLWRSEFPKPPGPLAEVDPGIWMSAACWLVLMIGKALL